MSVRFVLWIAATQCVNFAFYLAVTRMAYGWVRTVGAYVSFYLVPLTVALWLLPTLHGEQHGAAGALSIGFLSFFILWAAVTIALSQGPMGRRLFSTLACCGHQITAFVFSLLILRHVHAATGGVAAVALMVLSGIPLIAWGLKRIHQISADSVWLNLNAVAIALVVLLYSFGIWTVLAPNGSWEDAVQFAFVVAVGIVVTPLGLSSAERNHERNLRRGLEDNLRILLAELRSAHAAEEGARRVRHDTRHHVAVVREMLAAGRVKEADEYLANASRHELLQSMGARNWCANALVNAILSVAERKAAVGGKTLAASADVPAELPFDEPDVVSLVGNLLENALCHGEPGDVRVSLAFEHGRILRLTVANAVKPGFALLDGGLADEGVGLRSVRAVVGKYHGLMGYELKEGQLVCKVVIGCV